jgi:hypothetical protein
MNLTWIVFKKYSLTLSKHPADITKTSHLMLYKKLIAIYVLWNINTSVVRIWGFWVLNLVVDLVSTGP